MPEKSYVAKGLVTVDVGVMIVLGVMTYMLTIFVATTLTAILLAAFGHAVGPLR